MIPGSNLKQQLVLLFLVSLSLGLISCAETFPGGGAGSATFDKSKYENANSSRGGRLYDKWWAEKNIQTPTGSNPIWEAINVAVPSNNNGSNGGQWRCKECHGWDYKGFRGAYKSGSSHYTGIRGVDNGAVLFTPEHVFNMINNGSVNYGTQEGLSHRYVGLGKMNTIDAYDLTNFVVKVARRDIANPLLGDKTAGKTVFEKIPPIGNNTWSCDDSACHSATTTPSTPSLSSIIQIAKDNPQEFLHKVRFGAPNSLMPDGMSTVEAQDVYAYVVSGAGVSATAPSSDFVLADYEAANIKLSKGGLLYDKWWEGSTGVKPAESDTHPRYADSGNSTVGPDTWRCKECHGWDYRGTDGAYASGSHSTGFQGIVDTSGFTMNYTTAEAVYGFLKEDTNHGSKGLLSTNNEYYALTKFVMTMRDETATPNGSAVDYIDYESKLTTNGADATAGKALYLSSSTGCGSSSCHGEDGKRIDFKEDNDPTTLGEYVHNIALDNPWEFVHKTRFGQPGSFMPALADKTDASVTTIKAVVDILASAQTNLVPNIKRGGLLYDEWWKVQGIKNATVPTTRNATWIANAGTTDTTKVSNESTWRCKECHGWDYQGVDGAYGYAGDTTGKHYSGIRGFLTGSTSNKPVSKEIAINIIKNGTGLTDHDFGRFLSDTDIEAMADFILDPDLGIPDSTSLYQGLLTGGNPTLGKTFYEKKSPGNCASAGCHGPNGTNIPTVDVAAIAKSNPQEFIHKVRYGNPGSIMLPSAGAFSGLDLETASDVLAYAKTLTPGTTPTPNPDPGTDPTYTYATADMVRGGRLYDEWWKEMEAADTTVTVPVGNNPLWDYTSLPLITPSEKSWRCKSCHAWNYKGVGFYDGTPSETGKDNLIYKMEQRRALFTSNPIDGETVEESMQMLLYQWIKNGIDLGTGTSIHNYGTITASTPLGERELWDLVKFLLEGGLLDSDPNFLFGQVVGANGVRGSALYTGGVNPDINCTVCHGTDGKTSPPADQGGSGAVIDIFKIASPGDDPWEFLHKIRFGQPGTSMPAILGATNLDNYDAFDILGYAQEKFKARP